MSYLKAPAAAVYSTNPLLLPLMPSGRAGATREYLSEPTILGRRSYKIPKGETTPVWTSELEDALLQGAATSFLVRVPAN